LFKQLFEVIAAPEKAHATENQRQKQLSAPTFPYFKKLKLKAPMAHNGAIT